MFLVIFNIQCNLNPFHCYCLPSHCFLVVYQIGMHEVSPPLFSASVEIRGMQRFTVANKKMDDQYSLSDTTQLRDFQCPICLKYFSRKFTLDMHLLIHKGVKPHACPFCGKSFRQKGTLMRHKALHSANNLFHCSLCDRGFRQKNVFLYHLRHRHSVSTETLDRRKYPTELKDYQSIMDTLPPFVLADSTAIASSEKHLDAMLFETLSNGICDSSISEGGMQNNCFDNQGTLPQEERQPIDDGEDARKDNNIQVNEGFGYKCDLCLIFFNDYSKYKKHVEEQHNNVEMLLDSKPILRSSLPESYMSSSRDVPRNNVNVLVSSDDVTSHLSVTNNLLNAKLNMVSSTNDTNCIEKGNFCVPCQLSFANEEEFECHLKTHVQSVLEESNTSQDKSNADNFEQSNSFSMSVKSNCDTPLLDNGSYFDFPSQNERNITSLISNKGDNSDTLDKTRMNITPLLNSDLQVYSTETNSTMVKKLQSKVQLLEDKVLNMAHNKCSTMSDSLSTCVPHFFYKCKLCNKMFQKRVTFEYHKQMHMNTRAFECDYCKKKLGSKQLLLSHTRSKHLKTFKCGSCSRTFNYHSIFVFHKKNCSKNVNLEKGRKGSFNLPLIRIQELLSSDVTGITGVIPICDKSVSKNSTFKYGIPIVSVEAMRNFSNFSFLNTLEIKGSLK